MNEHRTEKKTIGVLGAGSMGAGIAQIAASSGHPTVVCDLDPEALEKARENLERIYSRLVEKGKITAGEKAGSLDRLRFTTDWDEFGTAACVIEAIVEDLEIKKRAFADLEETVSPACLLATNTSSLSVTAIAAACARPGRVLGLHFFNPAPLMPLVEVASGLLTDEASANQGRALAEDWGKTAVQTKDTPGFIVNRVARPFYGESLRLLEEGEADAPTIDWALRELGGFRMGPFELMDLIGNDVNYAVTESVYRAFFYDPRYKPSLTQKRMVEAGLLGRKSGRGYYDYRPTAKPPAAVQDRALGQRIFDRVLAMLVNEAVDAVFWRIATPEEIDLAMTRGVNYPKGLLEWGDEIGLERVLIRIEALQAEYVEDRYRPSPLLKRMARERRRFFSR